MPWSQISSSTSHIRIPTRYCLTSSTRHCALSPEEVGGGAAAKDLWQGAQDLFDNDTVHNKGLWKATPGFAETLSTRSNVEPVSLELLETPHKQADADSFDSAAATATGSYVSRRQTGSGEDKTVIKFGSMSGSQSTRSLVRLNMRACLKLPSGRCSHEQGKILHSTSLLVW
jgi:hypothetical protein